MIQKSSRSSLSGERVAAVVRQFNGGLTRRRSWHGPASARRPSRLGKSKSHGVTRRAFARLTCSAPRAALASARGRWPCSLASDPLAGHRYLQSDVPPPIPAERASIARRVAGEPNGTCARLRRHRCPVLRLGVRHTVVWREVLRAAFRASQGRPNRPLLMPNSRDPCPVR